MKAGTSLALFSGIIAVVAFGFAGCGNLKLSSAWKDHAITVDGSRGEWQDALMYVEKANASVGLFNDAEHLYICLCLADRQAASQIARGGLTAWFDPQGGEHKTFGIRFPLGRQPRGTRPMPGEGVQQPGEAGAMPEERMQEPPRFREMFEDMGSEMEILGPGKDDCVTMAIGQAGIEVKAAYSKGRLVYELKAPLAGNPELPYAIGAGPGKTIGIGFETSKPDRKRIRERTGRPGGVGGFPPPGRGMSGRGGMPGPPGGAMPEPFELWAKVTLASEGSSIQQ